MSIAEIVVRIGILRHQPDRLGEIGDGTVVFAARDQHMAAIVELQRPVICHDRAEILRPCALRQAHDKKKRNDPKR
jgi:hypothetical protein